MSALREYLLAFADDEHLMGQQHTEWIGVAPFLEEDLAFASIGQDELGHSVMLYELVCELDGVEPTDAVIDSLAYGRGAAEYRSCALTERVTADWAEALVRHWIYDSVEHMRWSLVAESSHESLTAVSERVRREESYHRMHADALLDALLPDAAAREAILAALELWTPMVAGLLAPAEGEDQLVSNRVLSASSSSLLPNVAAAIEARFDVPVDLGDASTIAPRGPDRSLHFAPLMTRMREVLDLDPNAQW